MGTVPQLHGAYIQTEFCLNSGRLKMVRAMKTMHKCNAIQRGRRRGGKRINFQRCQDIFNPTPAIQGIYTPIKLVCSFILSLSTPYVPSRERGPGSALGGELRCLPARQWLTILRSCFCWCRPGRSWVSRPGGGGRGAPGSAPPHK